MQGRLGAGKLVALIVVAGALIGPQAASADITSVFGGDVACTTQSDGVRFCGSAPTPRSTAPAWDGVPIDVNVAFPPAPAIGPDGTYPLIMLFHGYGGGQARPRRHAALARPRLRHLLDDRPRLPRVVRLARRRATAAGQRCDNGYIRLIDNRYEVRDAQEFAGQLADEGLIDPQQIGAIGGSYGGGMSMALGALKDRMMLPDDSARPLASPDGTPMQIAAAAPDIPWTDLAYSLTPNGSTLDYVADAPYRGASGSRSSRSSAASTRGPGGAGLLRAGRHRPDRRPHRLAGRARGR